MKREHRLIFRFSGEEVEALDRFCAERRIDGRAAAVRALIAAADHVPVECTPELRDARGTLAARRPA